MMAWIEIGSKLFKADSIVKVISYDKKGSYYIDMWTAHPKYAENPGMIMNSYTFKKITQVNHTFSFTNPQTRDRYYKKLEVLVDQNVIYLSKNKEDIVKLEE